MMNTIEEKRIIYGIDEVEAVAHHLAALRSMCDVFTFTGSLGAGKTTLVRTVLQQCGVKGPVTSPTFTYVNLYENEQGQTFYHFDCYRLSSTDDFVAAGFDEYLYQPNSWSFIEWPDVVMPLLDHKVCHVTIDYHGDEQRELRYKIIK